MRGFSRDPIVRACAALCLLVGSGCADVPVVAGPSNLPGPPGPSTGAELTICEGAVRHLVAMYRHGTDTYRPSIYRHQSHGVPLVAVTTPLDSLNFNVLVQRLDDVHIQLIRCGGRPNLTQDGWTDGHRQFEDPLPSFYLHVSIQWVRADSAQVVMSRWYGDEVEVLQTVAKRRSGLWEFTYKFLGLAD